MFKLYCFISHRASLTCTSISTPIHSYRLNFIISVWTIVKVFQLFLLPWVSFFQNPFSMLHPESYFLITVASGTFLLTEMPNKVQIFMLQLVPTYSFSKTSFQRTACRLPKQNFLLFFDASYNSSLPFFCHLNISTWKILSSPLIEIISILQELAPTLTILKKGTLTEFTVHDFLIGCELFLF